MTAPVDSTRATPEHVARRRRAEPPAAGDPRPSGGSGGAVLPSPLLRVATERARDAWRNEFGEAASDAEAHAVLAGLTRAVAEEQHGRTPTSLAFATTPLGRHLLDLLRSALLAEATLQDAGASPELLLDTLRAMEAVRATIAAKWGDYFASRLSAPDALELVVEVAHDLRSPLTSILFLAETLQLGQSGEVNELQRRQLGLIYSAALGLSALSSDVIELARGGDRLVEREPSPLSVNAIFESVRDIVRPLAEEKRLGIRILPPSVDHRVGYPLALARVLLNLTTNALKFTEEGFVELVAQERGSAGVEISVRDTGRGINPAAVESLYAAFRRAPGRAGFAFSGTGLGLAICRRLVEAMGSELKLESRQGWGTRFSFELALPPAAH